ncbi:MAG: peptidyl-alpha-hydroxyglycine alpha-amidating lyase family protein [Microvirga sp.]
MREIGSGAFRYRVNVDWARPPEGWWFNEVSAVGVDRRDRVYVFSRSDHPMMVFDREGNFLKSWGEGQFVRPHGVHIAPNDTIFLTDDGADTVRQFDLDGNLLLTIGTEGKRAPFMSGLPFHRCTHSALSPDGDIYITDGYGNARIHKYTPDGRHLMSWGGPGSSAGEFNVVHNIVCDAAGYVYVADRENHRIQVFDGNGRYQAQWNNVHRPNGLGFTECGCRRFFVGENGPALRVNHNWPNLGPRISILDGDGTLLARLGSLGHAPGEFIAPHGIAADSRGDIYLGEVALTGWPQHFEGPAPPRLKCLQKLEKLPVE